MKRIWQKPKLIILERGRPEESVLQACKTSAVAGPNTIKNICYKNKPCNGKCSAIGTS
jgi:hypothetical protein